MVVYLLIFKFKPQCHGLNRKKNINGGEALKSLIALIRIFQNSPYALEIAKNPVYKHRKVIIESANVKLRETEYEKLNVVSRIYVWYFIPEMHNKHTMNNI